MIPKKETVNQEKKTEKVIIFGMEFDSYESFFRQLLIYIIGAAFIWALFFKSNLFS